MILSIIGGCLLGEIFIQFIELSRMTFGFGRDTDEVNGFESLHGSHHFQLDDGNSYDTFDDSSNDLGFAFRLPSPRIRDRTRDHHPKYNPSATKCSFCKEYGHSLMNCWKRMEYHWLRMDTHCKHGYHKPHLHDCEDLWRCEWCLMHLKTSYVKKYYPREYDYEIEKVRFQKAANLQRYSDSADS